MKIIYILVIIMFATGVAMMLSSGCDGYWENCNSGIGAIGIILCTISIALPILTSVLDWFVRLITKHEGKND